MNKSYVERRATQALLFLVDNYFANQAWNLASRSSL